MTPSKAKEIVKSFLDLMYDGRITYTDDWFDRWLATPQAQAILSGEDWKEDGMPLAELIEETWDKHSQLIGRDIDDLDYWAGRDAMKASDFEKAVNEIVTQLKSALPEPPKP